MFVFTTNIILNLQMWRTKRSILPLEVGEVKLGSRAPLGRTSYVSIILALVLGESPKLALNDSAASERQSCFFLLNFDSTNFT